MHKQEGFSLIELMVVICVLAVGLGLAVPSFSNLIANDRMSTSVNDLVTSLHAARSEAIKRQATVMLCPAPEGANTCSLGDNLAGGWLVFVDRDQDAAINGTDEILQRHGPISAGTGGGLSVWPADAPGYIAFSGTGVLGSRALTESLTDIQICDGRGDRDTGGGVAAGRLIQIQRTGHPEIRRMRNYLQELGPLGGC